MRINKLLKTITVVALAMALTTPAVSNFAPTTIVAEAATPKISKANLTLEVNKTEVLTVKSSTTKATWTSSNGKVASVGKKTGKVTGKKVGTATITGKIGTKKYTCKVKVVAPKAYTTVKEGKISAQIPTNWIVDKKQVNSDGIKAYEIFTAMEQDTDISGMVCTVVETSNVVVDTEAYRQLVESEEMKAEYKKLAEESWGIEGLEFLEYNLDNYKAPIGEMVKLTCKLGKDKEEVGEIIYYGGAIEGYTVQVLGIEGTSQKATPTVEKATKQLIDTLVIK